MFNPLEYPACFEKPRRLMVHPWWSEHVPFAFALVQMLSPSVLVELGTYAGESYCAFCQAVDILGLDTACYAIDTWEGDGHIGSYGPDILEGLRSHHDPLYGRFSRLIQSRFDDALSSFSDGSIDILHIDGYHTYEAVRHDYDTWLPKMSERGVILFHDTNVYEGDFGVWRLWEELQHLYPSFEFKHGFGLGVLAVGKDVPKPLNILLIAKDQDVESIREFYHILGEYNVLNNPAADINQAIAEKDIIIEKQNRIIAKHESRLIYIPWLKKLERSLRKNIFKPIKNYFLGSVDKDNNANKDNKDIQSRTGNVPIVMNKSINEYHDFLTEINYNKDKDYIPLSKPDMQESDIKLIAFYLPQFHPIPENDEWWGRGFTEWTNVSRSVPQFIGHYQPRLPGELGFYDLRLPEVMQRQIELAKQYGIHGFCFHYYWFDGKTLLEKPIEQFLSNPDLDMPFCINWANENWSRRWDGLDDEVLISQRHSPEDDIAFIEHVSKYLKDSRYIRVNGKPLLMVYRPALLPDVGKSVLRWRDWCRNNGIGEIYVALTHSFEHIDPREIGFDAAVEFAPNNFPLKDITHQFRKINTNFEGHIYDYESAIEHARDYTIPSYKKFRCLCPSWDNNARRPGSGNTLVNSTPKAYGEWLEMLCSFTRRNFETDERIVFINAWNEWAESAYLEPDRKYGYAYLNVTAKVMNSHPWL